MRRKCGVVRKHTRCVKRKVVGKKPKDDPFSDVMYALPRIVGLKK